MSGEEKLPILVVEDEEPIRRGLCDVLAYHGYAPAGAADGAEGLREGLSNRYALILLDPRTKSSLMIKSIIRQ